METSDLLPHAPGVARRAPAPDTGATTAPCRSPPTCAARILRGEFAPGQRLKIDDIAALCKVSHMPVRVALQDLEAEGVLDLYPHRGAVIRGVDARFVRNMLELRAAMEVMLTERCARSIDKAGLAELDGARARLRVAAARDDALAIVSANLRLHHAINRVADNPEALQVLGRGRLLIQALRVRFGFGPGRVDAVIAEHRALLRAIAPPRRKARRRDRAPALRGRARRAAGAAGALTSCDAPRVVIVPLQRTHS